MGDALYGYDMVVAISQAEINHQFSRLIGAGDIERAIRANGFKRSSSGVVAVSSTLRAAIDPPSIRIASNLAQVTFGFDFVLWPPSAKGLAIDDASVQAAFPHPPAPGQTQPDDGLIRLDEDLLYLDADGSAKVLARQRVPYWLQRSQVKLGSSTRLEYSLVPALFFGGTTLVDLSGLRLDFDVALSRLTVTAASLPDAVHQRLAASGVDPSTFEVGQLFLDFDSADFAKWARDDLFGALGTRIRRMELTANGSFTVTSVDRAQLQADDPEFATQFVSNLEYTFAGGRDTLGHRPLVVGYTATPASPPPPGGPPSIIPTYIGYSVAPNATDPELSSINYQVLVGADPGTRIPRHNGTPVDVATSPISNKLYSGVMRVARSAFFDPFVAGPLTTMFAALNASPWVTGSSWTGTKTDTGTDKGASNRLTSVVTTTDVSTVTVTVSVGAIGLAGTTTRTRSIHVADGVLGWVAYERTGTLQWSDTITMVADPGAPLDFVHAFTEGKESPLPPLKQSGDGVLSVLMLSSDLLMDIASLHSLSALVGDLLTTAIKGPLEATVQSMKANSLSTVSNRFVSPTGDTFFLNNPRFDDQLDLIGEITYSS